jgi:hypothetical protein
MATDPEPFTACELPFEDAVGFDHHPNRSGAPSTGDLRADYRRKVGRSIAMWKVSPNVLAPFRSSAARRHAAAREARSVARRGPRVAPAATRAARRPVASRCAPGAPGDLSNDRGATDAPRGPSNARTRRAPVSAPSPSHHAP